MTRAIFLVDGLVEQGDVVDKGCPLDSPSTKAALSLTHFEAIGLGELGETPWARGIAQCRRATHPSP